MITKHFNLEPEDHSRSSARKNIKPFNIDDVSFFFYISENPIKTLNITHFILLFPSMQLSKRFFTYVHSF